MWGYYGHMYAVRNPGFLGIGWLPIILVLGVILLIWAITRHQSDNEEEITEDETALEILKKRYARGEITKRQYLEMKKDIQ